MALLLSVAHISHAPANLFNALRNRSADGDHGNGDSLRKVPKEQTHNNLKTPKDPQCRLSFGSSTDLHLKGTIRA